MAFKKLFEKQWVVYARRPFGGAKQVVEYLGRYTHKVAISNHRIVSMENNSVTFLYKDYKDEDTKNKKMISLMATEFIRRYCLHFLPKGFRKIRHYGFLSNQSKQRSLEKIRNSMKIKAPEYKPKDTETIIKERMGIDTEICPCCGEGQMITIAPIEKVPIDKYKLFGRAPPAKNKDRISIKTQ